MQTLRVILGVVTVAGLLVAAGPARAHEQCDNDSGRGYRGARSVDYRDYGGSYDRYRRYAREEARHDRAHERLDREHDRLHDRLERAHERAHERGFYSRLDHERFHDRLDRAHERNHDRLDNKHDVAHHRIFDEHDRRYHGYRGYEPDDR